MEWTFAYSWKDRFCRRKTIAFNIELLPEEQDIIARTLSTGDLDLYTNYFMRLPNSGSMWMPDDAIGHYRHLFGYEFLFDAWGRAGKPDEFDVVTLEYQYHIRIVWDGTTPNFLYPHGYLFLPWVRPVISRNNHLALVITATGTAKTSSVAVAALTYCVLYPGFHFLNVAPSTDQATLMIDEMEKWISGTPFGQKFVKPTRSGELYLKKPYPHTTIISPLNPTVESWFACQTVGRDADNILGKNQDWINIDEVQLMNGISEAMPKLMTRMRAQRSDGTPRWSKLSMLTNPGDNPELDEIKRRITAIQANPQSTIDARFIEGIDSSANVYNTKKQREFHKSLMDVQDEERWLEGKQSGVIVNRMIPEVLLTRCFDEALNVKLREDDANPFHAVKRDGIGLIHYQIPYEQGHFYIVSGDPGQATPVKRSLNNVPVVTVFDITHFLVQPSRLVYYHLIDGCGSYTPWLEAFRTCMTHYRANGYYDATNINTAFEDAGAFEGYSTTPVTFAVLNKRWARSTFINLAQDGMFAWPHIERLWYEASIYRETGEGHLTLADDLLASMFVYCLALRIDGGLWDKLAERYHYEEEPEVSSKHADGAMGIIVRSRNVRRPRKGRRR